MSQKRVAIVLAVLVGSMTLSAGALLLMEDGASAWGGVPQAIATSEASPRTIVENGGRLQSAKWNFIIIYESQDVAGTAASLAQGRVEGVSGATGSRRPADFHFVIGNGQDRATADGGIETSNAWLNQDVGTPVVGWPNFQIRNNKDYKYTNAVGICAIGDISQNPLTDNQNQSLLQLVAELRLQCRIPADGVKFYWELSPNDRIPPTAAQKAFAQQFRRQMD